MHAPRIHTHTCITPHTAGGKNGESAEDYFKRVMEESSTLILWPSRLKIGAKSKKGSYTLTVGVQKKCPYFSVVQGRKLALSSLSVCCFVLLAIVALKSLLSLECLCVCVCVMLLCAHTLNLLCAFMILCVCVFVVCVCVCL